MAGWENIGELAKGLTGGYHAAQMQKRDREDRSKSETQEKANRLLELMNSSVVKENPVMQRDLLEMYADTLDQSEAGPRKQKKGGIGSLLKGMFGFGNKEEDPEEEKIGPYRELLNRSEQERQRKVASDDAARYPRSEDGSRTFGSLDSFLGTQPSEAPMSREGGGARDMAFRYGRDDKPATDLMSRERTPTGGPMSQGAPQLPRSPEVQQENVLPNSMRQAPEQPAFMSGQQSSAAKYYQGQQMTPDQLVHNATQIHTGKYGMQDKSAIKRDVSSEANRISEEILGVIDEWRAATPWFETIEMAYEEPTIRKAIDRLKKFEAAGLIEKGLLEGRFVDKLPEAAAPETLEDKVARDGASSEERQKWLANIAAKAQAGVTATLNPKEQAYAAAYSQAIKEGKTPQDAYKMMEQLSAAPQQPDRSLRSVLRNGIEELAYITDQGQGKQPSVEYTGVKAPQGFNDNQYKDTETVDYTPVDARGNPGFPEKKTIQKWSLVKLKNGLQRGFLPAETFKLIIEDPSISPQERNDLRNFGQSYFKPAY